MPDELANNNNYLDIQQTQRNIHLELCFWHQLKVAPVLTPLLAAGSLTSS